MNIKEKDKKICIILNLLICLFIGITTNWNINKIFEQDFKW